MTDPSGITQLNTPANPAAAITPETCEHPWDTVHDVDEQGVDTVRCSRCNGVLAVHAVTHDYQVPPTL